MNEAKSASEPVTDLTYLAQFCEGDEARMKVYTKMYVAAVPRFAESVAVATEQQDVEALAGLMHSFKPKCLMMGMKKTNELRAAIEVLCNNEENTPQLYELLEQFGQQLAASVVELEGK